MMRIKKIVRTVFMVLFLSITFGCSSNEQVKLIRKNIHTTALIKAVLGNEINTGVRIIETYSNEDPCVMGKFNANLYLCRNIENNDTIYVFNICDKVPSFATQKIYEVFVIDHEDILVNIPKTVIIKVPETFSIPHNSKCVFANLTRLED